jgi:NhaA family Na+:H+ antiporter
MNSPKSLLITAARPFRALFVSDAFEGLLLIFVAALAMFAANSAFAGEYHDLFHATLAWTPIAKLDTFHLWINDALMAVFFFVVGLEVKREVLAGELADPQQRRLPVVAAISGMAVPAAIYLLVALRDPSIMHAWAIPAATDIAFAMGVVGLLGKRVPPALRLFLLSVAIVDDIGAVLIIALFHTATVKLAWLGAAALLAGALFATNRLRVTAAAPFALLSLALWFCVLHSGVHATIAGVIAAMAIPLGGRGGTCLLETMEHALVRWNAYLIVPLFGFANAGISLAGIGWTALIAPLPLATAAGLAIGKQAGILASVALAERTGFAARPEGSSWAQVWGASLLCGIGFTMSLFIAGLAFPGDPAAFEQAKLGVLAGTLVSMVLGYAVLRLAAAPWD